MSAMSYLQEELCHAAIAAGDPYGFDEAFVEELAQQYNVTEDFVATTLENNPWADVEDDYDDSMDGDFDSAMASAGYGMDEDYGCFDEC